MSIELFAAPGRRAGRHCTGSNGGRPARSEIVDQSVATVFGVAVTELRASTRRSARVALARQVAMYLAHVTCGFSLSQVGGLFGRDRTTVAHACRLIEDRRDEPAFDRTLEHLERAIKGLAAAVGSLEQRR